MSNNWTMKTLVGKTITSIEGLDTGSDCIIFTTSDNLNLRVFHDYDCCESVYIDRIEGDTDHLIDSPILFASEEGEDTTPRGQEHATETIQTIRTEKGVVRIVWFGESNGCYAEWPKLEGEINH